jgi:DNA-binding HxlR family transcriptional regulator
VQKLKECEEYSCANDTGIDYVDCPIGAAIALIGGKWKLPIMYNLRAQTMRFNALKKALSGVTQKMLTQQLRELERDGLVYRKVYAEVPPKVEYSLTPIAKKLEPILASMCAWGMEYREMRAQD